MFVLHILHPHNKIIEYAKNSANRDTEDHHACERLIKKLMVPVGVVDREEREHLEAKSIEIFF